MSHKLYRTIAVAFIVLLFGLAVAVGLGVGPARAQGLIYVDDDTCPAVGDGSQTTPYCRIQTAVDAAGEGDEIRVAAGTYTGTQAVTHQPKWWGNPYTYTQVVIITKTLTLRGGYDSGNWGDSPDPTANPTIIDAERQGRGVSIVGTIDADGTTVPSVTVDGFTITGGDYTGLGDPSGANDAACSDSYHDCGGGLYAMRSALTLRNSVISNNIASRDQGEGGGIYLWELDGDGALIENTTVISNSAPGSNGGWGGGLYADDVYAPITINQSVFQDNTASGSGGGLYGYDIQDLVTIVETDFASNTAQTSWGGGARIRLADNGELLHMDRVHLQDNQADSRGAAILLDAAGLVIPQARLTNLILSGNRITATAPTADDAVVHVDGQFTSLEVTLAHVTAADNQAPTFLYVEPSSYGSGEAVTATLKNVLVASFTNAFAAQELAGNRVLIHHTNTLTDNVTTLHQNVGGSPTFVAVGTRSGDPKLDATYHLQASSVAIDAGVNAGVTTDIDGEARPDRCFYDIGADEFITGEQCEQVYLPLVLRNHQ
jgi:hypothetical protein